MLGFRLRSTAMRVMLASLFVTAGVLVATDFAEARAGRSGSFGSRGARTWSTPAPSPTAPTAAPMQRSTTPQSQTGQTAARPAAAAQNRGGMFGGGFMGGMMGGLLGAGLFGLLMGGGFFSGLGSMAGILGLLLQVALIFIVVRLVMGWMRSRREQASSANGAPLSMQRSTLGGGQPSGTPGGSPTGSAPMGGAAPRSGFGAAPRGRPLKLEGSDFDSFERLLGEVQSTYSRQDREALARLMTPEMASYMGEELDDLAQNGWENRLSDVKLLQGDLSEAWSEGTSEFATVAMRYQITDVTVDKATGRVVQGNPDRPEQVVEFWTFVRAPRGKWQLSAIQQG